MLSIKKCIVTRRYRDAATKLKDRSAKRIREVIQLKKRSTQPEKNQVALAANLAKKSFFDSNDLHFPPVLTDPLLPLLVLAAGVAASSPLLSSFCVESLWSRTNIPAFLFMSHFFYFFSSFVVTLWPSLPAFFFYRSNSRSKGAAAAESYLLPCLSAFSLYLQNSSPYFHFFRQNIFMFR